MEIIEVSPKEYDAIFTSSPCFNKAAFNVLNAWKCEEVFYFIFKDRKIRMGLIAGRVGNALLSPFSAPFGGFSTLESKLRISYIEEAVDLLEAFCRNSGIEQINITLPPLFYDESFLTKVSHVLYQKKWLLNQMDLNFFLDLRKIEKKDLMSMLTYSARKNLKTALKNNFTFGQGQSSEDLETAYEIIRINRESKGYPLSMTRQQMLDTSAVVTVDSFLVHLYGKPVAAAIVYQVTENFSQVVYWGDLPEYSNLRTMNFLTYYLFEHYSKKGFMTIDVGTSMLDNMPNYGLCEFKESIGCDILPRNRFVKDKL
jgi:hypothetical protein